MTKLKQKLLELGYEYVGHYHFSKTFNQFHLIIQINSNKIYVAKANPINYITFDGLDDFIKANNQLQNDLKELKEYENI